jgi:hypothetical protein
MRAFYYFSDLLLFFFFVTGFFFVLIGYYLTLLSPPNVLALDGVVGFLVYESRALFTMPLDGFFFSSYFKLIANFT